MAGLKFANDLTDLEFTGSSQSPRVLMDHPVFPLFFETGFLPDSGTH